MLLHAVMRLLISEETPRDMYPFCQESLEIYVTLSEQLYGQQLLSYNVHSLLHLVADVEVLGPLDTFNALCYENNMLEMRKCLRKPGLKLAEVYKTISEKEDYSLTPLDFAKKIYLTQKHAERPLPKDITADLCEQFKKLEVNKCTFAITLRDRCCFLKNSKICIIKNIIQVQGQVRFIVQQLRFTADVYNVGVTSEFVQVYDCRNLERTLRSVPLTDVKSKMYIMQKWSDVEGEEELIVENQ